MFLLFFVFCAVLACLGGLVGLILEVLGRSWSHLGPSWTWSRQVKHGQVKSGQVKSGQDGPGQPPQNELEARSGQGGVPPSYKDGSALETHPLLKTFCRHITPASTAIFCTQLHSRVQVLRSCTLETLLAALGRSWGDLGHLLGTFWTLLGRSWGTHATI